MLGFSLFQILSIEKIDGTTPYQIGNPYTMASKYQKNADGQYICSYCDYTANYQSTMHYHLAKHEGALPYKCKYCSQRFLQNGILELHYTLHHSDKLKEQEKEVKVFKCPVDGCSYQNAQKGNCRIHFLRIHMKTENSKLRTKAKEEGFEATCTKCQSHFKSNTQFYYPTHSCVLPGPSSALASLWKTLV